MKNRLFLFLLLSTSAWAKTVTVKMTKTKRFDPEVVTISPGDTVKWINTDIGIHSATAYPKNGYMLFSSGMMRAKQEYSFTFKEAGSYEYFCIPHVSMKMKGVVVVK